MKLTVSVPSKVTMSPGSPISQSLKARSNSSPWETDPAGSGVMLKDPLSQMLPSPLSRTWRIQASPWAPMFRGSVRDSTAPCAASRALEKSMRPVVEGRVRDTSLVPRLTVSPFRSVLTRTFP